jgi:histidinol-phosphate phosphatase family protein
MSTEAPAIPCVFFDRDGIINVSPGPGYVERVEDFHIQPPFVEALRVVRAKGYAAVVITNQRGVGRGIMTREALDAIHARLAGHLAGHGLDLDAVYVCTANDHNHPDRKPNPGLLMRAAADRGLDLARSWMVGDQETDIQAGHRAGCRTVLVNPGVASTEADVHLHDMAELAPWLARTLPSAK